VHLSEFQRKLARRVRVLRERRGLRQDDLEEFEIAWKSVQKLEYGLTDPKASTLLKLASAFGISLAELVDFDRNSNSDESRAKPTRRQS
jgi:transcriptional regulator with XRE-family HTH domain